MTAPDTIHALNRIHAALARSLAVYLQESRPFLRRDASEVQEAVARLAAEQQEYAEKIAAAITRRRGHVVSAQFPLEFTSKHDLDLGFLLRSTVEHHRADIQTVAACLPALGDEPGLRSLVEEMIDSQRRHLEALEAVGGKRNASD